jgi:hypothetical protein
MSNFRQKFAAYPLGFNGEFREINHQPTPVNKLARQLSMANGPIFKLKLI